MNPSDELSSYYAELLEGSYDCVDRVVLNAYFPMGQTGGGLRTWWRQLHGSDANLNDDQLRDMAGTFSRRLRAYCARHQVPLIDAEAGQRKHELAEEHLPRDPKFRGLFLVITGNAPAPVWEVKRNAKNQIIEVQHRRKWPYVKHYYFHRIDPAWGHGTLRRCGYPPFGTQVILNGHEWVERQAQRQKVTVAKSGNCFVEGSDFAQVNRLAVRRQRESAIGKLAAVCERWLYSSALCFALTREEPQRSGFQYQDSVFQLELSRNLLFARGATMDEVYQKLIDRTRQPLELEPLKTLFGFRHRPRQKLKRGRRGPEVAKEVHGHGYDLTVFKVRWGNLSLKIYDKGGRVLRVEVVVHNAKELRCGKVLQKLPVLLERMSGMLVRFLNTVQVAHGSFLDQGAFERWAQPSTRGTRRLAGIDLNKARNRHVVDAVVGLATQPEGFSLAELAGAVRARTGWGPKRYSTRQAAYDLAKLRGKKLVQRKVKSRRYVSDPSGVRTMCAYLLLRETVIKPLLAGVVCPAAGSPRFLTHWTDTTLICARNSTEPLKPSDWQHESPLTHIDNLLVSVLGLATKIHLDQDTDAWLRRLVVLSLKTPDHEQHYGKLAELILKNEAPGILNWLLEGRAKLAKDRLQLTQTPEQKARAATLLLASDSPSAFVRSCLVKKREAELGVVELYEHYQEWCREKHVRPFASRPFTLTAKEEIEIGLGLKYRHDLEGVNGKARRGWKGLALVGRIDAGTGGNGSCESAA